VLCIGLFYKPYAYFFREHKPVRFYSNPVYPVYSLLKYAFKDISSSSNKFSQLGLDASIPAKDQDRELIIMVVGETARADHFSLNGYSRKTNPLLEQESLFNFTKMTSCGTSTAISVPCMFSFLTQQDFSNNEANQTENILDILTRAGVNVLWRDNNSSSKGVADRITFQDFRRPDNNPICDIECRDEGLLSGLQEYIDTQKEGDILIVLHQMGNHGPAYYKRYTKEFEVFKPACQTAQLEDCNQQEIHNAYDNAILYTDYFLSKAIQLLKQNSTIFETGLFYASDHGESLGEKGIYLHGLPNIIAPNAQTQVPAFLWLGQSYKIPSIQAIRQKTRSSITHDHIFHSLLGLFEVDSAIYNEKLDILSETD
jgi:lipid A ethanolaminephosphotransferase